MTPEHRLMNEIRLWCGQHDLLCFRCNVGKFLKADGTWFDTGLPVGFSDLIIFDSNGHTFFIECKVKPNKPSTEQTAFLNEMQRRNFKSAVIYSLNDFIVFVQLAHK